MANALGDALQDCMVMGREFVGEGRCARLALMGTMELENAKVVALMDMLMEF